MSSNNEDDTLPLEPLRDGPDRLRTQTAAPGRAGGRVLQRVGHYHIKRVIASGGMGTVYEAVQEHPRRTVAVKVMKQGIVSRSALRRFEYESQLLARLRHPGIAQVYEAGTHRDDAGIVPYFAMEYIPDARSITRFVQDERPAMRERLALFARVCDAVHHGHQKGIIHRDLKPVNILVDTQGQPKIIDFGVARSTDSDMALTTLQTDVGQLIGTLQYMSPEQCRADPHDLDVRSDVYALGVVLYELLCSRLPYDVTRVAMLEATRLIREERPPRLATIDRTLRGDIETIVLKALEKERERRYQSAADLAGDIRRYLHNEPISARPPSLPYQLRVFARRHKAGFAAIAAVFVVLVVGAIVSTALYVQAEGARALAEARRAEADAVSKFLNRALSSVDPAQARGQELTVRELLDQASAELDRRTLQSMPLAEATLRLTMGRTYRGLGRFEQAEPHLREALRLRRDRLGDPHLDVAEALTELGALHDARGRPDEASAMWRRALNIRRELLGDDHELVAESWNNLGVSLYREGKHADAESLWREVLAYRRAKLGDRHADVARSLNNLAVVLQEQGKYAEAEAGFRESLAIRREILGDLHPASLESVNNLGSLQLERGDYRGAVEVFNETLEMYRRLHRDSEHTDIARCLCNFGDALARTGDVEAGERKVREAIAMQVRLVGPDHVETGMMQSVLGELLTVRGDAVQAESVLLEARRCLRKTLSADHPVALQVESLLGACLSLAGRMEEAEPALLASFDGIRRQRGPEHAHTRAALRRVIEHYERAGASDKADQFRAMLTAKTPD